MPPEWISSLSDFSQYVYNSHREAVNANSVGTGGEGIHIAILDSMQSYPHDLPPNATVVDSGSFVKYQGDLSTSHGAYVFDAVAQFAPWADYSFYQVVDRHSNLHIQSLKKAVDAAINSDVDIINISLGESWQGPPEDHPYTRELQRAVDAGIIVVAAAGNYEYEGERPSVYHPASAEDIVSVGGFITTCPCSPDQTHNEPEKGPYYVEKQIDDPDSPADAKDIYCGYNGCSKGESCFSRQSIKAWPGNPREDKGDIDILAPPFVPVRKDELAVGSSHAAPIVAGVLAEALGNVLDEEGVLPDMKQVHRAIQTSAAALDNGDEVRLDGFNLFKELSESVSAAGPVP